MRKYVLGKFAVLCVHAQSCLTLVTPRTVAYQVPLSTGFSRQETGVGCHALYQGIFLTQESIPHLLHLLHWQGGSSPLHNLGVPNLLTLI